MTDEQVLILMAVVGILVLVVCLVLLYRASKRIDRLEEGLEEARQKVGLPRKSGEEGAYESGYLDTISR